MKKQRFFLIKDIMFLILLLFVLYSFQSCGYSAKKYAEQKQYEYGAIKEDTPGETIYDFSRVITKGNHSIIPTGVSARVIAGSYFTYSTYNLIRFTVIINEFEKLRKIKVSFTPVIALDSQIYLLTTNEPIQQVDSANIIILKHVEELIKMQKVQSKRIKSLERKINKISSNLDSLKK